MTLGVLTATLCGAILAGAAWTAAGRWLVVEDPLRPGTAAVVFSGHLPFRAMEAAAVYREGWVQQVWLTHGKPAAEDRALEDLGIQSRAEHVHSRDVLLRLGVKADDIRLLPEEVVNTADEIRAVARALRDAHGERVILVTSKSHTRRVRALWTRLAADAGHAVVRPARGDPFDADRWWGNSADALTVTRETFGLVNAWLGFPVRSERPASR